MSMGVASPNCVEHAGMEAWPPELQRTGLPAVAPWTVFPERYARDNCHFEGIPNDLVRPAARIGTTGTFHEWCNGDFEGFDVDVVLAPEQQSIGDQHGGGGIVEGGDGPWLAAFLGASPQYRSAGTEQTKPLAPATATIATPIAGAHVPAGRGCRGDPWSSGNERSGGVWGWVDQNYGAAVSTGRRSVRSRPVAATTEAPGTADSSQKRRKRTGA